MQALQHMLFKFLFYLNVNLLVTLEQPAGDSGGPGQRVADGYLGGFLTAFFAADIDIVITFIIADADADAGINTALSHVRQQWQPQMHDFFTSTE